MIDAARRKQRAALRRLPATRPKSIRKSSAEALFPDVVTDQTSAHDLVYGYVPAGAARSKKRARCARAIPQRLMAEAAASICRHVAAMLGFQKHGRDRLRQRQSDPHPGPGRRS